MAPGRRSPPLVLSRSGRHGEYRVCLPSWFRRGTRRISFLIGWRASNASPTPCSRSTTVRPTTRGRCSNSTRSCARCSPIPSRLVRGLGRPRQPAAAGRRGAPATTCAGCCSSTPTSASTRPTAPRCATFLEREAQPGFAYGFEVFRMEEDAEHYDPRSLWVFRLFSAQDAAASPLGSQRLHFVPVPSGIPQHRWLYTSIRIQHEGSLTAGTARRASTSTARPIPNNDYQMNYDGLLVDPPVVEPWPERPPDLPVLLGTEGRYVDVDVPRAGHGPAITAVVIARNDRAVIDRSVRALLEQEVDDDVRGHRRVQRHRRDRRTRGRDLSHGSLHPTPRARASRRSTQRGPVGRARRVRHVPGLARVARARFVASPARRARSRAGIS